MVPEIPGRDGGNNGSDGVDKLRLRSQKKEASVGDDDDGTPRCKGARDKPSHPGKQRYF